MEWLIHNPIADMYGPRFLLLYGGVIALTLVTCWWLLRQRDATASLRPPLIPSQPDPLEIAYLRGGENEVTRVIIFDLLQRNYLRLTDATPQKVEQAPDHPDTRHLSTVEDLVFAWFSSPASLSDIFQSERVSAQLAEHCNAYEQRLHNEQLLLPAQVQQYGRQLFLNGAVLIGGLGGYKLLVALYKGYWNVWFLIIMGVAAIALLRWLCKTSRLSQRGQAYVKQMQLVFERLKERTAKGAAAIDPAFSLLVGVFGLGVLTGTSHQNFMQLVQEKASKTESASSWGVGCGSGCGSCGGGGCGGGCGGCGG